MANFIKKFQKIASQGLSILNGAVGDKLENSFLEVSMGFYHQEKKLSLEASALKQYCLERNSVMSEKICILIHGLTHNETAWDFPDKTNYGTFLEKDFQFTPFYLRYNTGSHISDNGKKLADLLETLYKNYAVPIQEICIISHSMGGLVTHSACHYAQEYDCKWTEKLKNIFLLATPHAGSFLEKFANITTNILEKVPNWQTRLVGDAINLRSAGIKDLRFGYLREEDWNEQLTDNLLHNTQKNIKKIKGASYYIIAGRLTKDEKHWLTHLFGDILVNTESAKAEDHPYFFFPPENCYEFAQTNHFKIQTKMEVYEKIKNWLINLPSKL